MNTETFLKQHLAGKSLGIILDVGCGDGTFLDDLLSLARAQEVWGIDIDDDALSEARAYMNQVGIACRFLTAASPDTGLRPASFDNIAFRDLLHHLSGNNFSHEPDNALQTALHNHLASMNTLLRPGGRLIISECIVDDHLPTPRHTLLQLHNLKAEIDGRHGISHSYSMNVRTLKTILHQYLAEQGYTIEASATLDDPPNPQSPQSPPIAERLDHFAAYIATLENLPDCAELLHSLRRRFAPLRAPALKQGLLPQRRLLLIAHKSE